MRILTNELTIAAPVETVFQWFIDIDSNYLNWHPETHEELKWITKKPVNKGSLFYFIETVCGNRRKILMEVTEYEENSRISFGSKKITICSNKLSDRFLTVLASLFQIRIEMKRNFHKAVDNSTRLHTTHIFGSDLPIVRYFVNWVLGTFVFSVKAHETHMREENENMKTCIECL